MSMIAFCALLKWQPWVVRLQLGEFILAMPVIAVLLSSLLGITMPLLLIFMGWKAREPAFYNLGRPLFGIHSILRRTPVDVLFSNRPELESDYVRVADAIAARRPKQVGVFIGGDGWEFPLWFLLRQRLPPSEMPIITNEMNEKTLNSRTEMVVCVDYHVHPRPDGMREIPGSGQVLLYERQN